MIDGLPGDVSVDLDQYLDQLFDDEEDRWPGSPKNLHQCLRVRRPSTERPTTTTDRPEAGWKEIKAQAISCLTKNLSLLKVMNFLQRTAGDTAAADRYRSWINTPRSAVVYPDRDSELLTLALLTRFLDQPFGWTDCLSIVTMRTLKIKIAFGFDGHFRLAGFNISTEIA